MSRELEKNPSGTRRNAQQLQTINSQAHTACVRSAAPSPYQLRGTMPERWPPSRCLHSHPPGRTRKERRMEKRRERMSCSCGPGERGPLGRGTACYSEHSGLEDFTRDARVQIARPCVTCFSRWKQICDVRLCARPKEAARAGKDSSKTASAKRHRPSEEKRSERSSARRGSGV